MTSVPEASLASLDIVALLRDGLGRPGAPHRRWFGEGAVGAAVQLAGVGALPQSLTYLASVVQAGGVAAAARLPEPLPQPAQAAVVRPWLEAAAATNAADDEDVARWLRAVATVLGVRAHR